MRRMRRALANPPPNDPLEGVLDVRASLNERKPKIRKRLNLRRPGSEYVNEASSGESALPRRSALTIDPRQSPLDVQPCL